MRAADDEGRIAAARGVIIDSGEGVQERTPIAILKAGQIRVSSGHRILS
jgi:hypothetical protein